MCHNPMLYLRDTTFNVTLLTWSENELHHLTIFFSVKIIDILKSNNQPIQWATHKTPGGNTSHYPAIIVLSGFPLWKRKITLANLAKVDKFLLAKCIFF